MTESDDQSQELGAVDARKRSLADVKARLCVLHLCLKGGLARLRVEVLGRLEEELGGDDVAVRLLSDVLELQTQDHQLMVGRE